MSSPLSEDHAHITRAAAYQCYLAAFCAVEHYNDLERRGLARGYPTFKEVLAQAEAAIAEVLPYSKAPLEPSQFAVLRMEETPGELSDT